MNRRNFIKSAAVGATAIATFPFVNTKASTKDVIQPASNSDAIDWINTNIKLKDPFGTVTSLKLNADQIHFIQFVELNKHGAHTTNYYRYIQRKNGYTTVAVAYALYLMCNTPKQNILFMACNYKQAIDLANEFREMRTSLSPEYLKISLTKNNKLECVIGKSHRIKFAHCGNLDCLRGYSYNTIILQDFEFYIHDVGLMNCVYPTLNKERSKIIGYSFNQHLNDPTCYG